MGHLKIKPPSTHPLPSQLHSQLCPSFKLWSIQVLLRIHFNFPICFVSKHVAQAGLELLNALSSCFNHPTTRKTGTASTLLSFLHDVSQQALCTESTPDLVWTTLSLTGAHLSRINQGATHACIDSVLEGHRRTAGHPGRDCRKEGKGGCVLSTLLCFTSVKMDVLHFCSGRCHHHCHFINKQNQKNLYPSLPVTIPLVCPVLAEFHLPRTLEAPCGKLAASLCLCMCDTET